MKWASAISSETDIAAAAAEAIDSVARALAPDTPDVVFAFVSPRDGADYRTVAAAVDRRFPEATLFGCTGGGVIGASREIEQDPALSLTGAVMPDVEVVPYHLTARDAADLEGDPSEWWRRLGVIPEQQPAFIVLTDPFSLNATTLLRGLDRAYPECTKVGGLASGGQSPGEHALLVDDRVFDDGAVLLALYGDVVVDALVAQGCRPVGVPMTVTECDDNIVRTLDGHMAADMLRAQIETLPALDRRLFERSPQIGLAIDPIRSTRRRGDFLIRNLVGVDPNSGAIAVGTRMAEGVTVQLHVRDSDAAEVELDELFDRYRHRSGGLTVSGALLFSCLGRGEAFYGRPDHDSERLAEAVGPTPLGGFFCNGEMGPVHARTWLHGYTSVFALFRERGWS